MQSALHVGSLYRSSPHPMKQMFELCDSTSIHVLGTLNPVNAVTAFDPNHLYLSTPLGSATPTVYCPPSCGLSAQIILFDRPSPHKMQYMSLIPISLVLSDKPATFAPAASHQLKKDKDEEREMAAKGQLVEKLKLHTVVHHSPSQKEKLLPTVLAQINCSAELAQLMSRNAYLVRPRQSRSLSVGEKVVESATTLSNYMLDALWHIVTVWVWPVATRLFITALICHRAIAEVILRVLDWRLRPDSAALKDVSATAQQVDIRLQQFCYWPVQYVTLRKRKDDWESITDRHPDYIRFYNSLWLVANDVIIGIAVGSYIIDNAAWVAWQISIALNDWTIEGLMGMITWLMDWPAGLKLNNELAVFLGHLVIFMIRCWQSRPPLLLTLMSRTDVHRLGLELAAVSARNNLFHRLCELRWRDYACGDVFGSSFATYLSHLLLLLGVGSHIPLAVDNHHVTVPSLSRQETQRAEEPD